MRKRLAVVAAVAAAAATALALPGGAAAHPLGNFTVNHFAGIEAAGDALFVHVVLDVAEIPTLQIGRAVEHPAFAARLARDLELRVDGRRATLRPLRRAVERRDGAAGLETLRFAAVYKASTAGRRIAFVDRSYPSRIGWREITVSARDGARVVSSTVPASSESDALRAYPDDLLRSPLDVRAATALLQPGTQAGAPPALDGDPAYERRSGGLEGLIERGDLTPGLVLVALLLAAFWGAVHALTPGHGKALVAGYLVGARGTPQHAFVLGATVTVTHTIGVFALGVVTLALSRFVVPEQLYPWLTLISGVLVVLVGCSVLRVRLRGRTRAVAAHHHHGHGRDHDHEHGHHHHHDVPTSRGIVGVGVAAGLLPCPSALVVLLGAIAVHRVAFGLALIVAFSVGLAVTITAIGLVAVLARRAFSRVTLDGPLVRSLPAVSAAAILLVGLVITARALPGVL